MNDSSNFQSISLQLRSSQRVTEILKTGFKSRLHAPAPFTTESVRRDQRIQINAQERTSNYECGITVDFIIHSPLIIYEIPIEKLGKNV